MRRYHSDCLIAVMDDSKAVPGCASWLEYCAFPFMIDLVIRDIILYFSIESIMQQFNFKPQQYRILSTDFCITSCYS